MKVDRIEPPRVFVVGRGEIIHMKDCARIALDPDEQITFVTPAGGEYDVARKDFGFYATPSLNARLPSFGLRAAMSRNPEGRYFIFLVETGRENQFLRYLEVERNDLVSWLDSDAALDRIRAACAQPLDASPRLRCVCLGQRFTSAHIYKEPPKGEIAFEKRTSGEYRRELLRCDQCGHFLSISGMERGSLYEADYVDSTYGGDAGLRRAFDRIVSLPPEKSDNVGRVRRIVEFARGYFGPSQAERTVLDVGAGLCVFLHRMKGDGWAGTALDPDPRAIRHARETVGVAGICGDFMTLDELGSYDLITFNKVLEHVSDPVAMLARSARSLRPRGLAYVELPDGECAITEGPGREEFFIDHLHVFSMASVAHLARRAGFTVLAMERLREPSTKYTIRTFLARSE